MIQNQASLEQTREQLANMEDVVASLMSRAETMHPSQLSLLLEGPLDMIRQLRSEIDEYVGIERAQGLLKGRQIEEIITTGPE